MSKINLVSLILFAVVFTLTSSCKKEKPQITNEGTTTASDQADSCITVPDCLAVGKYRVLATYLSRNGSPNQIYDTTYGYTTVSLSELSSGVIQFKDDSITHLVFKAFYDSSALYGAGTTLFSSDLNGYGVTIIIGPNDSLNVDYYTGADLYGSANDWVGHKIQ